jgi:hypothetical protein
VSNCDAFPLHDFDRNMFRWIISFEQISKQKQKEEAIKINFKLKKIEKDSKNYKNVKRSEKCIKFL